MCYLHIILYCKYKCILSSISTLKYKWVIYTKFKIKKQEYENRTFRLPVELLQQLNKLASDKNISLNQLVVQCCEYAIDNLDDSEK